MLSFKNIPFVGNSTNRHQLLLIESGFVKHVYIEERDNGYGPYIVGIIVDEKTGEAGKFLIELKDYTVQEALLLVDHKVKVLVRSNGSKLKPLELQFPEVVELISAYRAKTEFKLTSEETNLFEDNIDKYQSLKDKDKNAEVTVTTTTGTPTTPATGTPTTPASGTPTATTTGTPTTTATGTPTTPTTGTPTTPASGTPTATTTGTPTTTATGTPTTPASGTPTATASGTPTATGKETIAQNEVLDLEDSDQEETLNIFENLMATATQKSHDFGLPMFIGICLPPKKYKK